MDSPPAGCWLDLGGNCPVQGFGEVDGHPCYFRARGTGWSLEIYAQDSGVDDSTYGECDAKPVFEYGEHAYTWPEAGWISEETARRHFAEAVDRFRSGEPSRDTGPSRRQVYDSLRRGGLKPLAALSALYGSRKLARVGNEVLRG